MARPRPALARLGSQNRCRSLVIRLPAYSPVAVHQRQTLYVGPSSQDHSKGGQLVATLTSYADVSLGGRLPVCAPIAPPWLGLFLRQRPQPVHYQSIAGSSEPAGRARFLYCIAAPFVRRAMIDFSRAYPLRGNGTRLTHPYRIVRRVQTIAILHSTGKSA